MRPDVSRSAPAPTCSVQNFLVGSSIGGVAAAGGSLETPAVQYLDITTMIFYESVTLQHACGGGDADAAYTEHVGEEFVGDVKTVAMSSILRHEQPTRQARLDLMKAQTGRGRRQLHHHHVNVTIEAALQGRIARQLAAERDSANAPSRARALHQRMQRSRRDAQRQLGSQHPLAAHHSHL